ncbi:MAG: PAS domain S-box protein, partial [Proteobacteria bacterium]|nr:PAS domain S-box protein [Pseudomonadota bacterium]
MTGPSERPAADSHSYAAPEWKALLDAAVDAIIVIDHRGRIETFNSAAEVIFGISAQEVLGKNVSILMPEPYRSEHD